MTSAHLQIICNLNNSSYHDGVPGKVDIVDFVFKKEPLHLEKTNNTPKTPFCTKKDVGEQYHNGKKLQKCFVKIQKLPNTYI